MAEKSKVFETTVRIGEIDLPLVIVRMTIDAWTNFRTEFRHMQARAERSTRVEQTAPTDAAFEAALAKAHADDVKATAFMREHITEYVSVHPSYELRDEDGVRVVTGEELFELYGRDLAAISTILAAIFTEHLLTAAQKKALRLARASGNGSATPTDTAASGLKPAPTAGSAEPSSIAETAAAMALPSADASSGETGP